MSRFLARMSTFMVKMLTFLGKMLTTNVSNDDHDMLVDVLFSSDDDKDVQTSSNISGGIANCHL